MCVCVCACACVPSQLSKANKNLICKESASLIKWTSHIQADYTCAHTKDFDSIWKRERERERERESYG